MCLQHTGLNEVSLASTLGTKGRREKGIEGQLTNSSKIKGEIKYEWRASSMKSSSPVVKVEIYFPSNWLFMVKLLHTGEQQRFVIWHVKNEIQ